MPTLRVRLFGRLDVQCEDAPVGGLDARKVQELLCYLLLNRNRFHCRESLADLLWADVAAAQSRKYLRQALWQLQAAVGQNGGANHDSNGSANGVRLLAAEAEWVGLNPNADIWLDVAAFECAHARSKGISGQALGAERYEALCRATDLYRGDLLEGWYSDWCLRERERLQGMYLTILDKLMDRCEAVGDVETGLDFGARSLACDHARERTYRRLMRLQFAGGDRTGSLRWYERCVEALRVELGVGPEAKTVGLCRGIRGDDHPLAAAAGRLGSSEAAGDSTSPNGTALQPRATRDTGTLALHHLGVLRSALVDLEKRVQREIETLQAAMNG